MIQSTASASVPPSSAGKTTQADTSPDQNTAAPAVASGFGTMIERERDLQLVTEAYIGTDDGIHAADIDRILHNHLARLGANIALLEQRYDATAPAGYIDIPKRSLAASRGTSRNQENPEMLPLLVAQHQNLMAEIDPIIAQNPDGQRGKLILTEVARNHEEMAWMLLALLNEDSVHARGLQAIPAEIEVASPEGNWENEGGASASQANGRMGSQENGAR